MRRAQQMLAIAGLALAVWAMTYGFYYAVWIEHQTLDHIGGWLAGAFQHAAMRDMTAARAGLDDYARAKYVYTREVDAHSHWIGMAMVLLALAALWNRLEFGEVARRMLAGALILGAYGFPLGVLLQNHLAAPIGQGVAVITSGLLIVAFAMVAYGFARRA